MILIILLFSLSKSCKYVTEFTSCVEGKMSALVTPITCEFSIQIIPDLPCDYSCGAGTYLDIDTETKKLRCTKCESGTYSTGGGTVLDVKSMPKYNFKSYCWSMEKSGWELNHGCTIWRVTSEGTLASGTGTQYQWYETSLVLYPKLVKQGSLILHYRKNSDNSRGLKVGDFYVYVDGETKYFDYDYYSPGWKFVNITLETGTHLIEIMFDKYTMDRICEVQIKQIEIRGTEFASHQCEQCLGKTSESGSENCFVCDSGFYLVNDTCVKCADGKYSLAGDKECRIKSNCTENDYHLHYSECENGVMQEIYQWNTPVLCDQTGIVLPQSKSIECRPCGLGKYYKGSTCEICPVGHYIERGDFGKHCEICPAGKYAPKIEEYSEWISVPENFKVFCISKTSSQCNFAWEPQFTYLVTSPIYESFSSVILQIHTNIIVPNGKITYSVGVLGDHTEMVVNINGVNVSEYKSTSYATKQEYLGEGSHLLKFVCYHSEGLSEACQIFNLSIEGSQQGGSNSCMDCAEGYYSKGESFVCSPCDSGFTSSANKTSCVPCEGDFASETPGPCKQCTPPTIPSPDHTNCMTAPSIIVNNSEYFVQTLSGSLGFPSQYCSEDRLKFFCFQTFYGPIEVDNDLYYLSVLNPVKVNMPSYAKASDYKAYAFAVIDKNKFSMIEQEILKPKDTCDFKYSKIIVNLGSEIKNITKSRQGFEVVYENGDMCNENQRFATKIEFVCDKSEKEGWPVYLGHNNCVLEFSWPTMHACEVCKEEMVNFNNGTCENGQRIVYKFEGQNCVFKNSTEAIVHRETCEESSLKSVALVAIIVISVILGVGVGLLIFLTCKTRKRYNRLVQVRNSSIH